MVRKNTSKTIAKLTVIPSYALTEAGKLMPRKRYQQMSFWRDLKPQEQARMTEAGRTLTAAMLISAASSLAIGEQLSIIRDTLSPYKGAFRRFLDTLNFTPRTAYRYEAQYTNALNHSSEMVVKAAIARGLNFGGDNPNRPFGVYTDIVKSLPPGPETDSDPDAANRYIDQVLDTRRDLKRKLMKEGRSLSEFDRESMAVEREPDFWLMQSYRMGKNSMGHVKRKDKKRQFLDSLVGMLMTELGILSPTMFSPEAVPSRFDQPVGRPRKQEIDGNTGEVTIQ